MTQRDQCGQLTGPGIDLAMWLLLASATLFTVGLTMTTASEWAAIYTVATLDLGLASLLAWAPISHRRLIITLLVVHGICTAVAGWWSWRSRLGTPLNRAKGSEPGRTLAAGWIILLALHIGLSNEVDSIRSAADTHFLALFIVAAIGIVMGTGYTKYSEARDSLTEAQRLTSSKTWQRARAVVEWSTRYHESF
ncbi:MAG TPA: hypothetical protein VF557_13590 [Jatrophihabitans sp.]|uniref:hypothetical protein n=1 Tax=Jatrophihabitans sp. TaxID=1932789 RepID=UPI002EDCCE50